MAFPFCRLHALTALRGSGDSGVTFFLCFVVSRFYRFSSPHHDHLSWMFTLKISDSEG